MGALNAAAVVGTVALAHRRGGRQLMFMTAAAVALMCASFQTEVTREIWNASAPLLLLTLQVFVCWSLACGEYRLLPLAVLLTSFEMQTYLTYLIPSVGLLGAGIVGLVVSRTREPARRGQRDKATGRANRSFRRWLLAALAVGLLCWSAPLMDQALAWVGANRGYGNLANLADAARSREAPLGPTGGEYAIVRALGIPPSWLRAPQSEAERVFEIFGRPDPLALVSSAAILIGLVICLVVAVRRRRPDVVAACGLALVLCGALGAVTASYPNTPGTIFSYGYGSWWAGVVGMWAWVCLGWSALTLWPPRRVVGAIRLPALPAVIPLGAVLIVGVVVAASQGPDTHEELYGPVATVVDEVEADLAGLGAVRVEGKPEFVAPVVLALRRHGVSVGTSFSDPLGPAYAVEGRRFDQVIDIREGEWMLPRARLIVRVGVREPTPQTITVSLRPARG